VIIDAVRTPCARRYGDLAGWHPADLAGEVLRALVARSDLDPALVEDVIMGCVTQVGAQSTNIGRNAVLAAGLPESVSATTIDRQCGSSQQAVQFAAQSVMSGTHDIVIAAGVEMMSVVPMFSNRVGNLGDPFGPNMHKRYADNVTYGQSGLIDQGLSAELLVETSGLTRDQLDQYAVNSHRRAAAARDLGKFDGEIVAVEAKVRDKETGMCQVTGDIVDHDTGIRDCTLQQLASLPPVFMSNGVLTAGNSSQISDGAAAVLIMNERRASQLGLTPKARIVAFGLAGVSPIEMLTAPIPATTRALDRSGLRLDDIAAFEVNEAFAAVVLAWQQALGVDPERVNRCGGAVALGHPLGASGARLMTTLVHELVRTHGYGLQTMCEAGGLSNATIIESFN